MSVIGSVLSLVLTVFWLLLIARVIVDWVDALSAGPAPVWRQQARRITHAGTEWAVAPVRRVLPPVRLGAAGIDLAVPVVFVVVIVLRVLVSGL